MIPTAKELFDIMLLDNEGTTFTDDEEIDKDSILSSYPIEKIK